MVTPSKTYIKLTKDERRLFSTNELNDRNKGLQEITEVLSNMEIDYFLTDGTLLGAIREQDFIPWDWDIEIVLLTESVWDKTASLIEKAKYSGFKYNSYFLSLMCTIVSIHASATLGVLSK